MKHAHQDFPSDVFICLSTVGAMLMICDSVGVISSCSVEEFLSIDMQKKFIKEIQFSLTKSPKSVKKSQQKPSITCYLPRSTNSHAYVNAGFLAHVDVSNNFKISGKPTI